MPSTKAAKAAAPRAAKPAAKPVLLITGTSEAAPADAKPDATAKPVAPPAFLARVQATADAMQYPFANLSNRDDAYLASYAYSAAKRGGVFTLADLLADATPVPGTAKRRNPFAAGIPSAPATDAGAIERAIKAGRLARHESDNGTHYSVTDNGNACKAAAIGRERAAI